MKENLVNNKCDNARKKRNKIDVAGSVPCVTKKQYAIISFNKLHSLYFETRKTDFSTRLIYTKKVHFTKARLHAHLSFIIKIALTV